MKTINFDKYGFLSNLCYAKVTYKGITYGSSEAAFQAQKTTDPAKRQEFAAIDYPLRAYWTGHSVALRPDWEDIKDHIMTEIVRAKFEQNPALRIKLIETKDALIENTDGNDLYWGIDKKTGEGKNRLGQILMDVRSEFQEQGIWSIFWTTDNGWMPVWNRTVSIDEIKSWVDCIRHNKYACDITNVKIIPPEADKYSMSLKEFLENTDTVDGPVLLIWKTRDADVLSWYQTYQSVEKAAEHAARMNNEEYWDVRIFPAQSLRLEMTGTEFLEKY